LVDDSFYIECVACQNANDPSNPSYVPQMSISGVCYDVPDDQILLRFRSAFEDKYKKLLEYVSKNKIENLPYIIAISTGELGYFEDYLGVPIPLAAMFGIGPQQISEQGISSLQILRSVKKGNVEIDMTCFCDDKYELCSGILFNNKRVIDYSNPIGSYIIFVINHNAKYPHGK
jgi:type I restriction enzyme S subunit